jgi:hypothetical protein
MATKNAIDTTEDLVAVDDNITVLSSGVKVKIKKVPQRLITSGMMEIFRNTKMAKDGTIRTEDMTVPEQLTVAAKIQRHHSTLLAMGVELIGKPADYYGDSIPSNWLKRLARSGEDLSNYDLDDEDDITFLFLFYFGFAADSDWTVLNEKAAGA